MVDEVIAAPPAEAEAPPVVETPPEQKPPERDKLQERVGELTYRLRQIEAENAQLKSKADPKPELVKPTLEQSGYDEDKHREAMAAYDAARIEQLAEKAAERLLEKRDAESKARTRDESFNTRLGKLSAEERSTAMRAVVTDVTAELIKESDVGVEILQHLAANQEFAEAIARLPEKLQAKEIGKLEARLEKAPAEKPSPSVSKAPPPPVKLEATNASTTPKASEPESDSLSDAEWLKLREKQVRSKR